MTGKIEMPLMKNNITRDDLDKVIEFLKRDDPILTQSSNVRAFEQEWSHWLKVKYSVFVNSGSSANLITMAAIKHQYGEGEIIGFGRGAANRGIEGSILKVDKDCPGVVYDFMPDEFLRIALPFLAGVVYELCS